MLEEVLGKAADAVHGALGVHLIALDGEQIVATVRLRPMSEFEFEVARVAVLPAWRSSGIGRQLVQEVEVMARTTDARVLELHPHAGLEGFYAALGYAKTDDPSYYVGENLIITMRKPIADTED